ncbi:MAG: hypothetical protein AB7G75_09965 [Candidatus Binatia bacterium]
MRRQVLYCTVGVVVLLSACGYPQRRWKAFKKDFQQEMKRTEEARKSPEQKCSEQGGTLYSGQCYMPDESGMEFDQQQCRLRAGLYINDQCLFPPETREGISP